MSARESNTRIALGLGIGLGCGLLTGWLLRGKAHRLTGRFYRGNGLNYNYKMVIVVRSDIAMTTGTLAARSADAAVSAFLRKENGKFVEKWTRQGMPKIVLKADSDKDLMDLCERARECGLSAVVINDAVGTKAALSVGPGDVSLVDKVTGHLKLF